MRGGPKEALQFKLHDWPMKGGAFWSRVLQMPGIVGAAPFVIGLLRFLVR
jgi:hypothetical protein